MPFERPDAGIPAIGELAERRQWVCWQNQRRTVNGVAKLTKVPIRPNGLSASSTDPASWTTFDECCRAVEAGHFEGVGYVFARGEETTYVVGIDLDKCRNPETGEIAPWAQAIVDRLNSYTEISVSGTGLHILVRGTIPEQGGRRGQIECYAAGRYFVTTGDYLDKYPDEIVEREEELAWFWWTHIRTDAAPAAQTGPKPKIEPGNQDDRIVMTLRSGRQIRQSDVIVPDKGHWPSAKHAAYEQNDATFKRTWERRRKDLPDQTLSSYDMALAIRAAMANWTPQEIAALILINRERHGDADKGARPDYVTRTVWTAIDWVAQGKDDRAASLREMQEHEARTDAKDGEDMARQVIRERLDLGIERIIQVGEDPANYFLVLEGGREVKVGPVEVLTSQTKLRNRLIASERLNFARMKPMSWDTVVDAFMSIIEVREHDTISFAGHMREMVDTYLSDRKPLAIEELDASRRKSDVVRARHPYWEGGQLWVSVQDAATHLGNLSNPPTDAQLKTYLSMRGFKHRVVGGDGTTRSYWHGQWPPDAEE